MVKIAGVAHPFKMGSLRISRRVHARSTASFDILDVGASRRFQWSQPVQVLGLDGVTPIFGGWIDDIAEESWLTRQGVSEGLIHRITCKDHHYLADKRIVVNEYMNMTAGAIVQQIITDILDDEGITAGTIEAGPVITRQPADHISAAEVIERVADIAGFVWKINPDRSLDFRSRTAVSAPIVAYGTGMLRGTVKVRRRNFSYRNKQFVISGQSSEAGGSGGGVVVSTYTEEIAGNGTLRKFPLTFGIQNSGTATVEVRRGLGGTFTAETLGFSWDPSVIPAGKWYAYGLYPFLHHAAAETVLGVNDVVRITYQAYPVQVLESLGPGPDFTTPGTHTVLFWVDYGDNGSYVAEEFTQSFSDTSKAWHWTPGRGTAMRETAYVPALTAADRVRLIGVNNSISDFDYTNASEVARLKVVEGNTTTGLVEAVANDMESRSEAESRQRIDAELNRWSADTIEVEYDTWNSQLAEGDVQTVNLPEHAIDMDPFLVDEVAITDVPTQGTQDATDSPLRYRISLVSGVTTGASGGAIGRAANPRRFSDLFGQLNDRVRLDAIRPVELTTPVPIVDTALADSQGLQVVFSLTASATTTGASVESSPDAFPNLTGWFRAHTLSLTEGQAVSPWPNEGSGPDVANTTGSQRPIYRANQVNGLAAVRFDGVDDRLKATGVGSALGTQNSNCVIVVCRLASPLTTGDIKPVATCTGFGATQHWYMRWGAESDLKFGLWNYAHRVSSIVLALGTWYVLTWRYSAANADLNPSYNFRMRVNGVDYYNTADWGTTGTMDKFHIGGAAAGWYFEGDVAEVITYDSPPSLTQVAEVENGLKTKYAIA